MTKTFTALRAREKADYKSFYGSKWRKARALFLGYNPWCAYHFERGQMILATVVDHIVPHRGDKKLFWDRSNWQGLCKKCHDRKTLGGDKQYKGYDQNGLPRDPQHPWSKNYAKG